MENKHYKVSTIRNNKYVALFIFGVLLFLLLLFKVLERSSSDWIVNLGDKYYFNKSEIDEIKEIKYFYTEFTNHHLSSIEKNGKDVLYSWTPGDIVIKKVRYNNEYIIIKGEHRDRKHEFYFLIIQKDGDIIHGPFTPKEFFNYQLEQKGDLLYILNGFIEEGDFN